MHIVLEMLQKELRMRDQVYIFINTTCRPPQIILRHVLQQLIRLFGLRHQGFPSTEADQDVTTYLQLTTAIDPFTHLGGRAMAGGQLI